MKKADTKGHTLHGPSYAKRPEQANPRGQKVDSWFPGAGGGDDWYKVPFWGDGNILEWDSGDGCTAQ